MTLLSLIALIILFLSLALAKFTESLDIYTVKGGLVAAHFTFVQSVDLDFSEYSLVRRHPFLALPKHLQTLISIAFHAQW